MALNLSRNTQVFISTVNGVHTNGGGAIEVDNITGGSNHAVGDVITVGTGATAVNVVVTAVNSGAVTAVTLTNNGRGSGAKTDNADLTQSATSGSGTGFAVKIDGANAATTTTFDGGRAALGLFKGNERDANTFKIGVLDGYSFSQANESTDVTINEAGTAPNRGSKRFNDSLAPAEWSFQTYARPFTHGTASFRASGTQDFAENILWAALSGQTMTTADKDTNSGNTTNSGISYPDANQVTVDFSASNSHELLKLQIYFALENTTYRLNECQVNQVEIDFSIDGIATLSWSGNATSIDQLTASAAGAIEDPSKANSVSGSGAGTQAIVTTDVEKFNFVDVSGTNDADYLRNKLSSLKLSNLVQGGGSASGGLDAVTDYDIAIIGGSITIANNITYLTPETLGIVDQPIGSFTGTRQISGTLNCYLDTKSDGSNDLLKALQGATNLVTNSFDMSLFMGGDNTALASRTTPVIEFDVPKAHLQIPVIEVADVISTNIEFMALGTTISSTNEMTVKAKGLTSFSETGYDKVNSNAV